MCCVLRRNLQCTCYAHEAMREDGELNGVELSAEDTLTVRAHSHANVAPFCLAGLTAWLHQDGTGPGKTELFGSVVKLYHFYFAYFIYLGDL